MPDERYARQIGLFGPGGQKKLKKSRAIIIGANLLADFAIAALASLGVGTIFPVAYRRQNIRSFLPIGPNVRGYESFFRRFNDQLNVCSLQMDVASKDDAEALPYADVIIDTTHDDKSKYLVGKYAGHLGHVMLGYATDKFASVLHADHTSRLEDIVADYKPSHEDVGACAITAGLIADEVRKTLLPRSSETRNNISLDNIPYIGMGDVKTAIVGAGALGNWVGIGMSLMNIPATIYDDDEIEATNLNRQFMFYDSVGRKKAETLAEKLSSFGPGFNARNERFEKSFGERYSLIVSCVDNMATRMRLNDLAVNEKITLVNGGTDAYAGNVEAYVPGASACLSCQGGIISKPEEDSTSSCIKTAENSTVISNSRRNLNNVFYC